MSWILLLLLLLLLFKELWGNVDSSSSEVLGEEPRPKIILAQFGAAEMEFGEGPLPLPLPPISSFSRV